MPYIIIINEIFWDKLYFKQKTKLMRHSVLFAQCFVGWVVCYAYKHGCFLTFGLLESQKWIWSVVWQIMTRSEKALRVFVLMRLFASRLLLFSRRWTKMGQLCLKNLNGMILRTRNMAVRLGFGFLDSGAPIIRIFQELRVIKSYLMLMALPSMEECGSSLPVREKDLLSCCVVVFISYAKDRERWECFLMWPREVLEAAKSSQSKTKATAKESTTSRCLVIQTRSSSSDLATLRSPPHPSSQSLIAVFYTQNK